MRFQPKVRKVNGIKYYIIFLTTYSIHTFCHVNPWHSKLTDELNLAHTDNNIQVFRKSAPVKTGAQPKPTAIMRNLISLTSLPGKYLL